jgi:hypothetical protein
VPASDDLPARSVFIIRGRRLLGRQLLASKR